MHKEEESQKFNFHKLLRENKSSQILNDLKVFINKDFHEKFENLEISEFSCILQEFVLKLTNDFAKEWKIDFKFVNSNFSEIINGFESLICKALYTKLLQMIWKNDKKFDKFCRKYIFLDLKHFKGLENVKLDEFELASQLKSNDLYKF
jgi:hypothetical protein